MVCYRRELRSNHQQERDHVVPPKDGELSERVTSGGVSLGDAKRRCTCVLDGYSSRVSSTSCRQVPLLPISRPRLMRGLRQGVGATSRISVLYARASAYPLGSGETLASATTTWRGP